VLAAVLALAAWLVGLVLLGVPTRLIILLAVAAAIMNLVAWLSHRLRPRGRLGALTGDTLAPKAVAPSATMAPEGAAAASSPTRWVGGASLRAPHRRLNASMPLAVLTLAPGSLQLSLQPRFLNRLLRINPLVLSRTDVEAFPVTTRGWSRGVGILAHDAEVTYFWTFQREAVLRALATAGFRVSWDERRFAR
jgi:hypothetical protein